MDHWLPYSLNDFLIFSPETYFRLFEQSNSALWPYQAPLLLSAMVAIWLIRSRHQVAQKAVLLWLALIWVFVGLWMLRGFYAQINPLVEALAYLFYGESLLLVISAAMTENTPNRAHGSTARAISGWLIIIYAYMIHPVVLLLAGRSFRGIELVTIAPDPTAIATIGILLLLRNRGYLLLMIIPCAWIIFTILTYMALR
ncbi:hypothetical protein BOW35_06110 [Solemya velum gill symbiont]|uniref:DUF6064 family protein n=1 Tax=Solemya velum gill symbiont TaxID=2340 RepID=UPI0009964E01|nr:DUF6064 family protein [Solemya velum gill symbiont]OOZ15138.1 hypothetical protein BOW27_05420 [Solemya velum gill symbiont]OOZ19824.1 hypothetical protein BOW29_05170 [Solemya velum gill symbiont]OOZ22644.1 hypothetical protein BOW30_04925 [Solemya velum gill symbiont]OOZ24719.1 hypothetical protein BOW31_05405 [Solemya velum gill symbiont]OOZ29053.1 hypothetical protein BOW33_07490 [Solemya velum gill symbiont]